MSQFELGKYAEVKKAWTLSMQVRPLCTSSILVLFLDDGQNVRQYLPTADVWLERRPGQLLLSLG